MGSSGPNPWAPYDSYKDCSLGICSVYCPQWCYAFAPPPPDDPGDGSGGTYFSPLVIAVIGILASAFLLVSYYTIITKYCRRRRGDNYTLDFADSSTRDPQMNNGSWQNAATGGLDEVVIKSIAVFKYKKDDHLVEGTDCSVCLSEFQEDESLRLLPKCTHAFHLPCIDTWLKSHSSCPLCRSNIASPYHDPSPMTLIPQDRVPAQEAHRVSNDVEAPTSQHRDETVLEIRNDLRIEDRDEAAASNGRAASKSPFRTPRTTEDRETEIDEDGAQRMRRSVSLNSGLSQGRVSVADTLRDCEDNVDDRLDGILVDDVQVAMGIGPSKPLGGEDSDSNHHTTRSDTPQIERSPPEMKRSISTGRSMFGRYGRGRNFI